MGPVLMDQERVAAMDATGLDPAAKVRVSSARLDAAHNIPILKTALWLDDDG